MKCPKCGVNNGKTNKFCRECGFRLEGLAEVSEQIEVMQQAIAAQPMDELALGQELFGIMRLYEDGDLDIAGSRIDQVISCNSESASAHSIKALICERKGDLEALRGNSAVATGYLQQAVAEYEAIIDLNPDSAADREKLVALRMKLAGNVVSQPTYAPRPASSTLPVSARIMKFAQRIPPPLLASALALVVFLALLSILLLPRGGKSDSPRQATAAASEPQQDVTVNLGQSTPLTSTAPSSGTNVYTFPAQTSAPMRPLQSPTPVTRSVPQAEATKLPPYRPELVLVPEPKNDGGSKPVRSTSSSSTPKIKIITTNTPDTPAADTSSNQSDGSSMLSRAIALGEQNRYDEARQSADQAIQVWEADLAAGRNTTSAQRGIDNAKRYIRLWESEK